ncbi:unnamed protein product, partial [Mesorhabditis spiculigera]
MWVLLAGLLPLAFLPLLGADETVKIDKSWEPDVKALKQGLKDLGHGLETTKVTLVLIMAVYAVFLLALLVAVFYLVIRIRSLQRQVNNKMPASQEASSRVFDVGTSNRDPTIDYAAKEVSAVADDFDNHAKTDRALPPSLRPLP